MLNNEPSVVKKNEVINITNETPHSQENVQSLRRIFFIFIDTYNEDTLPTIIDTFKNNRTLLKDILQPLINSTDSISKEQRSALKFMMNQPNFKDKYYVQLIKILVDERKKLKTLEWKYIQWLDELIKSKQKESGVNVYYRPALVSIDSANKENTYVYSCYDKVFSVFYDPVLEDLSVVGIPNKGNHYYREDGWKQKKVAQKVCDSYLDKLTTKDNN